jgi:hypothetical protein
MEKDYTKILEKEIRQEKLRGIFSGILAILVILICIVLIIAVGDKHGLENERLYK